MLKLSRLEVNGFKSFVDPVELSISSGITAIVGPNGCGKSNLSEAITWVLGEQSAKSLRGSRMEDVIFAGSAGRKPVGMAEVSLVLDADPSFPVAEDGRITIGRRVLRSGHSQYRINGRTVRLKEIKDLLMDTGLGIRAYSVIEQGKIGMILSGKPQERRRLIEEAAGITRYKARKRIAEVKLEEATANLMRLDDIIAEVERNLRSLKRQASAARRYEKRRAAFRALHDRVLRGRWFRLGELLARHDAAIAELVAGDAAVTADLARDDAALASGREALDRAAGELAEHHDRAARLLAQIEGRQTFLEGARGTLADIEERLERGDRQAEERRGAIAELHGTVGDLDTRSSELVSSRDEAARQVAVDEAEIADAEQAVREAQARQERERQALLQAAAAVDRTRAALQQQRVEIERRTLRARYLDDEATRLTRQVDEAEKALARIVASLDATESALGETTSERHRRAEDLDRLLDHESALGDRRRALERRIADLDQRRSILEDLGRKAAEHRRELAATLAEVGHDEPRFLADHLRAAAGWEHGVDHFLGALADAVVLAGGVDALDLAKRLSAADASGSLVASRDDERPLASPAVDDPAIVHSLAEALDLPAELAGALPPCYLVREAADAVRLAAAHPGVAFISEHRLWAQGGVLHVSGERAAPGVLARERELETIRDAIPDARQALTEVEAELERARAARTEAAGAVQKHEERIAELRRESAVAQARRQDAEARLDKLRSEHRAIAAEQAELRGLLDAADRRHRELGDELVAAEDAHAKVDAALEAAQASVERTKELRESLRTSGAGRRARLELLDERLAAHHAEHARVRRQTEESEREVAAWQVDRDRMVARAAELEGEIAQAEEALQSALEQRAAAQETVLERQADLDRQREALRAIEARVAASREARDDTRGRLEAARVEQARVRQDADHLATAFWDAFGQLLPGAEPPPAALRAVAAPEAGQPGAAQAEGAAEEAPTVDADLAAGDAAGDSASADGDTADEESADEEPADGDAADVPGEPAFVVVEVEPIEADALAALETQLAEAKMAVERMGPVNVLAAEEYDEQEERHGFLTEQRRDVSASVKSLRETIKEINTTSSARFRDTFAEVNVTFGETFTKLFRGGEAEMRLLDEEDLLESGIEIVARPPGKRAQNIMLLSGGEKALTAIALLFGLFQTKPSPFCILDEVDAPLDDANILRYVDLLREMAGETQFLIITHNKLTMEVASTLYGVTMEEKGVSKVVAVELDDVEPAREAAGAA